MKYALLFITFFFQFSTVSLADEWFETRDDMEDSVTSLAGEYKTILYHENTNFFQYAKITLRTINPNGTLKIAANVQVFFGPYDSSEFLTYEFDDVPLNILTRQMSMKTIENDISMIGFLKDNTISGEWFSTLVGFVGQFKGAKDKFPEIDEDDILVQPLSGLYRGTLKNTNSNSNLPENITFSFVTTQENQSGAPKLHVSGNTRLYLGPFNSLEYVELVFQDIQFNYFSRFLTAKTKEYGLTFKGKMSHDGIFTGKVFSDGVGEVGPTTLTKYVGP